MTPFYPLIQPKHGLSGIQKYLLRVLLGVAGKCLLHRDRVVEVIEESDAIKNVLPLIESDLSESLAESFWIPRRQSDRKRFNVERRDRSRGRRASFVGVGSWGSFHSDALPEYFGKPVPLVSVFPSPSFLRHLIINLGYDRDAAHAAFARPKGLSGFNGRPDRKRKIAFNSDEQFDRKKNTGYQRFNYGANYYVPETPSRRTMTGGGFSEKQVRKGLEKMRTDTRMKTALFQVVAKRQSPRVVADEYGFSRAKLDVYASRLRDHIRDLHGAENLS